MLINCSTYKDGALLKASDINHIEEDLKIPRAFVWAAVLDPTEEELLFYQKQFHLHPLAIEDAIHGHQRAKIDDYNDCLFVVIKTLESANNPTDQGEFIIFAGPNYILTIRHRSKKGFSNVRNRCENEQELLAKGSGFVLYALMDEIVDRYFPVIDQLEEDLEKLENSIFKKHLARQNIEGLFDLKQKLVMVNHVINPLFDAVSKLHGGRVPKICMETQVYYRDIYDHLVRINNRLDNVREMISTAIQVTISVISLNESEDNKRLAAWAALFAIPTMLAGIYGMNFKNIPELEWKYGYYVSILSMVIIDLFLYRAFKRSKWL